MEHLRKITCRSGLRPVVAVGVLLLVLCHPGTGCGALHSRSAVDQDGDASAAVPKRAGEAWGKALLRSFSEGEKRHAGVSGFYSEALRWGSSEQSAAILVSWGDYLYCSMGWGEFPEQTRNQVEALLRRSGHMPDLEVDELDDAMLCYVAATSCEPKDARAWMRIALAAEIELLAENESVMNYALRGMLRADGSNSVPYYLMAYRHIQRDEYDRALALVQKGNSRGRCETYEPPWPKNAELVYPEAKLFEEASVVGKDVPGSVLWYAAHAQEVVIATRLYMRMRHVCRTLMERGRRRRKRGGAEEGRQFYIATAAMGAKFTKARPRGILNASVGAAIFKSAVGDFRRNYPEGTLTTDEEALQKYERKLDVLIGVCYELTQEEPQDEENGEWFGQLFRGEVIPLDRREVFRRAIAALPDFPTPGFEPDK